MLQLLIAVTFPCLQSYCIEWQVLFRSRQTTRASRWQLLHSYIRVKMSVRKGTVTGALELGVQDLIRGVCTLLCVHQSLWTVVASIASVQIVTRLTFSNRIVNEALYCECKKHEHSKRCTTEKRDHPQFKSCTLHSKENITFISAHNLK